MEFKKVPALYKCFGLLDLLAKEGRSMGISEISSTLGYPKSTVYNMVYSLLDLGILENGMDSKFRIGMGLYALGKVAAKGSELIQTIHPYLEEIKQKTNLSAFLGIKAGLRAMIVDKVDSGLDIKISSEVGMKVPLLAGAGGKALLSQIPDAEIDRLLSEKELKRFTPNAPGDKVRYKKAILKVRKEGFVIDREEYLEGICAFAVPVNIHRKDLQAAIWVVGLKSQITDQALPGFRSMLKGIAERIETRFS